MALIGGLLAGTAFGDTVGKLLQGLGLGGSSTTTASTPFVRGGIEAGAGIDPKWIIGGIVGIVALIVTAVIATRK